MSAKSAIVILAAVATFAPSFGQAEASSATLDLYHKCLTSAIARNNFEQTGSDIEYVCDDKLAERYFNFLASHGYRKSQMLDKNKGQFVFIDMGQGRSGCYHQIENLDGTAASDFSCVIAIRAPQTDR